MTPIYLKLKNFFSHKESIVEFDKFNSALIIGNTEGDYTLSNGSGKSSIMESILWCLFNKSRTAMMDDIIFWTEKNCIVTFVFSHNSKKYKVVRARDRIKSSSAVEFYAEEDGNWINISGSTAGLTNKKIVEVIKFDHKTFLNSAYFKQNDISEFADADPGRKKEILKSIIDLSKWDDYEKEVKSLLKVIKSEAAIVSSKIEDFDEKNASLAEAKVRLEEAENDLKNLSFKYEKKKEELENVTSKYQKLKNSLDTDQWDKIVEENKELKAKGERLKDIFESQKKSLSAIDDKINKLQESLSLKEEQLSNLSFTDNIDELLKDISDKVIDFRSKASTYKHLLNRLEEKEIDEEKCSMCEQDISHELHQKLLSKNNEQIDKYKKDIIYFRNKLSEAESNRAELLRAQKDNSTIDELKKEIEYIKELIVKEQSNKKERELEVESCKKDFVKTKDKYSSNNKILSSLKNEDFQSLNTYIKKVKKEIENINDLFGQKNQEIGTLKQKIKTLDNQIYLMKEDKKKLSELNSSKVIHEKLAKLFGKNGIQVILLNAVIEDLENKSNEILHSICNEPIDVILETQRLGSDGVSKIDTLELKIKKDGFVQNFKSLSGGEQFRVSLAIRIGMSEILSKHGGTNLEFLLLDEINSPLDQHGTETLFVNVIKELEKKYKILVITHNESLKERFDDIIDVTKVNGESTTSFVQK